MKRNQKLKKIEIALLVGLVAALLWGAWSASQQDALSRKMIRLHVIANSDTQEDQALKLQVRDEILTQATAILEASADMVEAQDVLYASLGELQQTAEAEVRAAGYDYRVSARLEKTEFPLKTYDGFALPSGQYLALRIVIGDGAGENWWCVVFPPLCTAAATEWEETAADGGLAEEDISLITGETEGYVLKFRSLELWERFRQWLKKI